LSITAPLVSVKKEKWSWEIILSGGRSSIVNGFGKFKQASFADVTGGGGTAVPPPVQVSQSDMRSGLSWGIQVNRKKAISGKLDLSVGFGYAYYSTRMEVGARVDSVRNLLNAGGNNVNVNNYFRVSGPSGRSEYTNQFHFAGLSAELSWKIINRKKFSMYWRNGLQYNHLVGSTMLHYDYNLPGLYKDNSLLKKGQLFYTTGLSVPVGRLLQLSPYFNYGLTIVLNAGESRTHYNSAGLRLIFSLPKK
jgi:hypothetical protein